MSAPKAPGTGAVAILLAAALALALSWHLLVLRHAEGTSHPPYSSFRGDPLGTRALHEAFKEVPGFTVQRLALSARTLENPRDTVLLVLGLDAADTAALPGSWVAALEEFAHAGGRVVLGLTPLPRETWASRRNEQRLKSTPPQAAGEEPLDPEQSLRERWGFQIAFQELPVTTEGLPTPASAEREAASTDRLPESMDWRSGVQLVDLSPAWQTFYRVGGRAVVAQRSWGSGTLAITTDAYPFGNEGLVKDRQVELLQWSLGGRRLVVFDETHLGYEQTPGIAGLARHYRLEGFLIGTLAVLGLLVWRFNQPLVPRLAGPDSEGAPVQGLSSEAGLATLLVRTLPPDQLPRYVFEAWQRAVGSHDPAWAPTLATLANLVQADGGSPRHGRDPVATVAQMAEAVRPRDARRRRTSVSPLDLPLP